MKNTKQLVVLPGLGSDKQDAKRYKAAFPGCLVFLPHWQKRSLKHYKQEFDKFLIKHNLHDGEYDALGFSFGAYVLACSSAQPRKTVYTSMTPLFKRLLPYWPKQWKKNFGKRRFADVGFFMHKSDETFFVGEKEPKLMRKVASRVELVEGSDHNLFNPSYLQAVKEVLTRI